MAGDWIPMRLDLPDDPAVIAIAGTLGLDEFAVVGRLHRLWSWASRHLADGNAPMVTLPWVDRFLSTPGFAAAMLNAGWLQDRSGGITFPHFERWNSQSAKRRVLTARRVAGHRGKNSNPPGVTESLPEKRREEKKEEKTPPTPRKPGGEGSKPVAALAVPKPRDEMFDVIVEITGANPKAHGGRVAKVARLIEAEGITPAEFRDRLPAVVAQYAHFRSALDIATVEACWPWIRTPPKANGPPGGKSPFKTRGEAEVDFFVRTTAEALGGST